MRISDWSSDVCSSDLVVFARLRHGLSTPVSHCHNACFRVERVAAILILELILQDNLSVGVQLVERNTGRFLCGQIQPGDRKSVVEGKSVSARVDLGGRRVIKKNNMKKIHRRK